MSEEAKVEETTEETVEPTSEDGGNGVDQEQPELRLTDLESAHLDICEKDEENKTLRLRCLEAEFTNLKMQWNQQSTSYKQKIRNARLKLEESVRIRNIRLAEIEKRLKKIEKDFDFKKYIQRDDGTLVLEADLIAAAEEEPVAGQEDQLTT